MLKVFVSHSYPDRKLAAKKFPEFYSMISRVYKCGTWPLTLREERRLGMFEKRLLTKIFVPKRDKATGRWRKLYNAELNDLYCSQNIIRGIKSRRMRWAGLVAGKGEGRSVYRVFGGKT